MRYRIIVVGTSMGGLHAMETILPAFPARFSVPIVLVQHRGPRAGDGLATLLRRYSQLAIREPNDKEPIVAGTVYIAPPDYHLLIEDNTFALSTEGTVNYARPSIDVLFETAADVFRQGVIGVVLTGANYDGANGAARIKEVGGHLVVEDPHTAEVASMPGATIAKTQVDAILPLIEIGPYLVALCEPGKSEGSVHFG